MAGRKIDKVQGKIKAGMHERFVNEFKTMF